MGRLDYLKLSSFDDLLIMRGLRWAALILTIAIGLGQQTLEIKPRMVAHPLSGIADGGPLRRYNGLRCHLLVSSEHLKEARERGAAVVEYIPHDAHIVSVPVWLVLEDASGLDPSDKLSPILDPSSQFALVEFYPDVDMNDARSIVLQSALLIQDNPDLLDHHLLVTGDPDAIASLASWDEVAYVFPASDDLINGVPVNSCAGALTEEGEIGQSVVKIGAWGGSGANGIALGYAFSNVTSQLPSDAVKSEIARAFNEWAKYVKVTFSLVNDPLANQTIAVLFATGDHGDGYPFTSTAVLAHTFYPAPMNQEPIAGDMHFNDSDTWQIGSDVDLFSVALHETGHALGLGHSDQPGAVMYPYYHRQTGLTQEDIGAIQTLYPPADTSSTPSAAPLTLSVQSPATTTQSGLLNLSGTTTGGTGSVQVTWSSNRGFSGAATGSTAWTISGIQLGTGVNAITIVATDSSQAQASQTVNVTRTQPATPPSTPTLTIISPVASGAYNSPSASVTLSGTASDASGITRIIWTTSQGATGQASGTVTWSAGPLTLPGGSTVITISAYAQSGGTASQSVTVNYAAAADPPPTPTPTPTPAGGNTGALTLTIVSPSNTNVSTSASTIAFSGTATGAASVTWATSNGDSGTAAGAQNWTIAAIPVYVGSTTVTVRAYDSSGNSIWRSVTVARH